MIYEMAATLLLPLIAVAAFAKPPAKSGIPEDLPVFRAETALAMVRFHVVKSNRYVDTIRPEDLFLLEDGRASNAPCR